MKFINKILIVFSVFFWTTIVFAQKIEKIIVNGNERVSDETIIIFSEINIGDEIATIDINSVLKKIYNSNFFENVNVDIDNSKVLINVVENPIIQNVEIQGIKAKKNLDLIKKNLILKSRNSYNEYLLKKEKKNIQLNLKSKGYYFSSVETYVEKLDNNMVNIIHKIDLGNKAKIKKITFIGNKIFKDNKLKNIIISEEHKFWKFISGRKFINPDTISLDERLLKNHYLNKGFFNVNINSSFAKMIGDEEFELIFNIDAGKKIYFDNLDIVIPSDFDEKSFLELKELFNKIKGEPYSLYKVDKILQKIDQITLDQEFKSINAQVEETFVENKINLTFVIEETEKYVVEKINVYGNNVTRENVIRNQLEVDEGDFYNEILKNKSENNLKSLNFFKKVTTETLDGNTPNSKVINIFIEEKPTGEIFAGAGAGTDGATITAGIKENNYMGKGIKVEANGTLTEESFKGKFSVLNPNFNNSDKSLFGNIQALEIDQLKNYGYKTNKAGFEIGTGFEYVDDLRFNLSTRTFVEKIETDSTASARQKSQEGNYFDTFVALNFDYDKRNQRFKTSDGFRSNYGIDIPIFSENNTLTNTFDFRYYTELYEDNITSFKILLRAANSITNDDVKLTERLSIPYSRLRGFEKGKIGPKDGNDHIGGNYVSALNFNSTLPFIFENVESVDVLFFFDAANVWGVDYDSSLNDANEIRSSTGIGLDWLTPVGPLSFVFSQPITKSATDIDETFRFNIGTTF